MIDYLKDVTSRLRKNPELIPTPEYFEMTRVEQMKSAWTRYRKYLDLDPNFWLYDNESSLKFPEYVQPGVSPVLLHYGMFMSGI